ncbi:hypothetical protein DN824_10635 [Stutzerimonas nosocomialis]|uniref:Uncharacterized protein n=1 Tax=Stutzerimonas nosocomialis TaxID=1056496 RepID=A0A5R9QC15_9GAMM|nr:hypothetical protein DN826_09585 [Stutzerimonas nosocomialis]TLX57550.1 hypothetical protein DN824_10635 [Stutzerimonas nosocomialis]TLX62669.1 hypothetical protein DN820_14595 [Stutzerimonas nosocomialis]
MGGSLAVVTVIRLYANRFPVPQDDSFQSQPRQSALWAMQSRNGSAGWLERAPEAFSGPLVSGSEAIMRWGKALVKRFVVYFFRHYIFGGALKK